VNWLTKDRYQALKKPAGSSSQQLLRELAAAENNNIYGGKIS